MSIFSALSDFGGLASIIYTTFNVMSMIVNSTFLQADMISSMYFIKGKKRDFPYKNIKFSFKDKLTLYKNYLFCCFSWTRNQKIYMEGLKHYMKDIEF